MRQDTRASGSGMNGCRLSWKFRVPDFGMEFIRTFVTNKQELDRLNFY